MSVFLPMAWNKSHERIVADEPVSTTALQRVLMLSGWGGKKCMCKLVCTVHLLMDMTYFQSTVHMIANEGTAIESLPVHIKRG